MTIADSHSDRPIRVLHALGGLKRGGIETWLTQAIARMDTERFQTELLVHSEGGAHTAELELRGCRIHRCSPTSLRRPWSFVQYPRNLRQLFHEQPAYDIVHVHMHEFGGYVLRAAAEAGVSMRIAHSHNGVPRNDASPLRAIRAAHRQRLRGWVTKYATQGFACSQVAAESLYGAEWRTDPRWRILHYGIDLAPFAERDSRATLRADLGIEQHHRVVGHAGRFVPQKNHAFLLEVAAEAVRRDPNLIFLLAGDGPLRGDMELRVHELGLGEQVRFLGARDDVPQLMLHAMDLMVLPSFWEGLPVVVLEAQAAGLGAILSDRVSTECNVVPQQVEHVALDAGPAAWADRIVKRLDEPRANRSENHERLRSAGMTIDESVRLLRQSYVEPSLEAAVV